MGKCSLGTVCQYSTLGGDLYFCVYFETNHYVTYLLKAEITEVTIYVAPQILARDFYNGYAFDDQVPLYLIKPSKNIYKITHILVYIFFQFSVIVVTGLFISTFTIFGEKKNLKKPNGFWKIHLSQPKIL